MAALKNRALTWGCPYKLPDGFCIVARAEKNQDKNTGTGDNLGFEAKLRQAVVIRKQDRGPKFLRLANALSALYPKDSEEKRLLDAMLLAVPRG